MDDIRQLACPQCTAPMRSDVRDLRPGLLWICGQCLRVLVIRHTLTLDIASPDDVSARPIPEQDIVRALQRRQRGMPRDRYC